ncbi:hypothetical protein FB45DRAFT_1018650 [Roridomyces roridus]|uniref:Uncharacterized protein n=1 Tax=Roridomyces roridus TaxID=1738132 RepID=A0AAD7G3C3_9AGAR|nr:hypothetical protein FB45DRAFT_1018650 [Roridomyces roridus]
MSGSSRKTAHRIPFTRLPNLTELDIIHPAIYDFPFVFNFVGRIHQEARNRILAIRFFIFGPVNEVDSLNEELSHFHEYFPRPQMVVLGIPEHPGNEPIMKEIPTYPWTLDNGITLRYTFHPIPWYTKIL